MTPQLLRRVRRSRAVIMRSGRVALIVALVIALTGCRRNGQPASDTQAVHVPPGSDGTPAAPAASARLGPRAAAEASGLQVPPVPPAPPFPSAPPIVQGDDHSVHWGSSNDWTRLRVDVRGHIELTDDDRDVKNVSPNGYFELSSRRWFSFFGRRYEVRGGADGTLSRRFTVNGVERPVDAQTRAWIGDVIQRLVRNGFDADARVARILARQGPAGVLDAISRVSSDFARAIYFGQLVRQARLDATNARRALSQAGQEIHSDFELARVLMAFVDTMTIDETIGAALVGATDALGSDFEHARVLTRLLAREPRTLTIAKVTLASSLQIGSDFEKSRVLAGFVQAYGVDGTTSDPFFTVVRTIQSDFERYRVLSLLVQRKGIDDNTVLGIVQVASSIGSDFHKAQVLLQVVASQPGGGATKQALLEAAGRIGSGYERGLVLSAMLREGALR
jgi:hypothetical protein